MHTRREFFGSMFCPAMGAALTLPLTEQLLARAVEAVANIAHADLSPERAATDEDFWAEVQAAFTVDRSVINLNNGGVSPSPATVQAAMKRHLDFCNSHPPPIALWRLLGPQRESVREALAKQWGVSPEEVAITRNASESLQTCQFGMDLQAGDEIVTTTQDYGRMLETFRQRQRREGLNLRFIEIPVINEDNDAIVRRFEQAFTDRTRLVLVSHVINITGQILPVKDITAMARRHGASVIIDGAHSLAHFDFSLADLACDYFGTSLHKWLFAPHGTGLLYVRKERIGDLWPLMAAPESLASDIRKFEEIGTHPAANALAVAEALTFHLAIGSKRKEARLRMLRDYWALRLLQHDRVRLHTSLKPGFACGLATMQIDGIDSVALADWLWDRRHILTTAIKHKQFEGIRVTPSVYTTLRGIGSFLRCY